MLRLWWPADTQSPLLPKRYTTVGRKANRRWPVPPLLQAELVNEMSAEVVGWNLQESSLRGQQRAGQAFIHSRPAWGPEVILPLYSCLLCSDPAVSPYSSKPGPAHQALVAVNYDKINFSKNVLNIQVVELFKSLLVVSRQMVSPSESKAGDSPPKTPRSTVSHTGPGWRGAL